MGRFTVTLMAQLYDAIPYHTSNKQYGIDTPVIFRVICHLRILSPDHFASRRHQTQFTDIDFNDSTFGDYTQGGV